MIKPQTVEFIKGLAALFFFFLVLGGTVFLRWKEKIGPKLTGILLMGMLAIMGVLLGVVIDWQTLTARKVNSNSNSGEIICAHGLKIRAIDSQQQYLADGDFKVVYTYDVQNTSPVHIRYLVPDRAGWFGKDIKYKIEGQILGGRNAFYGLDMSGYSVQEHVVEYVKGSSTDITFLQWWPAVKPVLSPGETLRYSVIISTSGTERTAFTRKGSYAGIGTYFVADRLTCTSRQALPPQQLRAS